MTFEFKAIVGAVALSVATIFNESSNLAMASEAPMVSRAVGVAAPSGYVAYELRLWGLRAHGRFSAIVKDASYGIALERRSKDDDGELEKTESDRVEVSVVFLKADFVVERDIYSLFPHKPTAVSLPKEQSGLFVLKPLGIDPSDNRFSRFEATVDSAVLSGDIISLSLDERAMQAGYPYRGPFSFTGPVVVRRPRFPGEKSIIRVPVSIEIPLVLLER